ncbi:hypothetical protein, partial [Chryseobacterium gambrini]|uniref:hypothetical protein n=1 Tax=Chryseobacterium gambrini TaxID=373672 RepID=UPI003BA6EF01
LTLLSKPVNPMNKVNAKITLLFKFSSYSFSHFNNGISCILFEAYPAFRCNSSLRGSASLRRSIPGFSLQSGLGWKWVV